MKILIIRFSSIGDIVLTSPVVRCLKKQLPEAEIHFLTKKRFASLIESNPYIDKKFYLEDSLREILVQLRKEKYDLIIDLHHNLRSLLVKIDLGVSSLSFNKLNLRKYLSVLFRSKFPLPEKHIVDRYLSTVQALKVRNDGEGLDYFIPSDDQIQVKDLPLTHLHGFVAIAIGGQFETKKLPVERLKKVCDLITVPVILLGGKEDHENGEKIRSGNELKVFNGCGRFNLNQSAAVLRLAKKVITHDTGLMHISAALSKEIISVWGNTLPEFGMYPYFGKNHLEKSFAKNSVIVQVKDLYCRPCSKLGKKKCPEGHFNCMNKLDLAGIAALVSS